MGMVVLSQGYDEGWVSYEVGDSCELSANSCWLKLLVPWFYGEKLDHVKVNGWGNGFIINDDSSRGSEVSSQVVIVYWPQYLQWGGMLMIPIGGLLIWYWPLRRTRIRA